MLHWVWAHKWLLVAGWSVAVWVAWRFAVAADDQDDYLDDVRSMEGQ